MTRGIMRTGQGLWGIVLALAVGSAAPADTLREAMADAYRNSQLLEQNRYLLRVRDEAAVRAISALYPVISFAGNAARDLDADTLSATATLVGSLSLYQGGQRAAAIAAARETVSATRQELIALEQQVLLDAVTAYLGVWENMQVVGARERNVRVVEEQLRAARDRFEVGEDTRTDVAQAEAQLAEARSNLAAAQGALEIGRELFALAVGRDPGGLSGPGEMPRLPDTEAAAEALARQSHPAVQSLRHQVTAAELAVDQARGQLRPQVGLEARLGRVIQDPTPSREGGTATLSLSLSQPIYRGGQIASLERSALAQVEAARFSLNQQVLRNAQGVGNAHARLRIASAQIEASEQRIAAAQLAFEGVREEASLGARTTLDVLDAEQTLLEARIGRIQATTDLFEAAYAILSASGLLTVSHLNLDVPRYDVEAYGAAFPPGAPSVSSPQGDRLDSLLERLGRE